MRADRRQGAVNRIIIRVNQKGDTIHIGTACRSQGSGFILRHITRRFLDEIKADHIDAEAVHRFNIAAPRHPAYFDQWRAH
jgi:predicted metal-dependent phosphotriesterase family hydrolase